MAMGGGRNFCSKDFWSCICESSAQRSGYICFRVSLIVITSMKTTIKRFIFSEKH